MKLTKKSKPRSLTLGQIWQLYLLDTGTETAEFIIKTLDLCYPKKDREGVSGVDLCYSSRKCYPDYLKFKAYISTLVSHDI